MGAAHARVLVEHGAKVVIADLADDRGNALASELGGAALFAHLDVTDAEQWRSVVATAGEAFGPVTVLINNAGILLTDSVESVSEQDYRKTVEVNQIGPYLGMQAVIPGMKAAGSGSIINVSSTAGIVGIARILPIRPRSGRSAG